MLYIPFFCGSVFVFQRCKGGIIGIEFLIIAYRGCKNAVFVVNGRILPPYLFYGNAELDSGKAISPYWNVPEVELKVGILHDSYIGIAEDWKRKLEIYPHI